MFSICIPNYNYEKYLGFTFDSIFGQTFPGFEVAVADNNSTDRSVAIIEEYSARYPGRIVYQKNPVNLGFSANLDEAARLTSGSYMLMLSSDDVMMPEALGVYQSIIDHLPGKKLILCAANDIIDPKGLVIESPRAADFRFNVWRETDIDAGLSEKLGVRVYRVQASELLERSLLHCTNPLNFCATCYDRTLYHAVGGYGGGRMINPDKWFHWRIMAHADEVIFVDTPLFQYRWHPGNQTAQQAASGFLKYMVDEYRNVIEMSDDLLSRARMSKDQFVNAFISFDVFRHGMGEFSKGRWLKSLRIYWFGLSVFPSRMFTHRYFIGYTFLLLTTPLGSYIISRVRRK